MDSSNSNSNSNNNNSDMDKELVQRLEPILAHFKQLYQWEMQLRGNYQLEWIHLIRRNDRTRNQRGLLRADVLAFQSRLGAFRAQIVSEHAAAKEYLAEFMEWQDGDIWNLKEQNRIDKVIALTSGWENVVTQLLLRIDDLGAMVAEAIRALEQFNRVQTNATANVNARHLMRPEYRRKPEPKQTFKHAQRHKNFLARTNGGKHHTLRKRKLRKRRI